MQENMKLLGVFDIVLDCPKRVYTTGSTLSGSIVVQLSAATKVTCLAIQVLGIGEVYWTNRSTIDTSGNVYHPASSKLVRVHKNKEVYLKTRRVLYESTEEEPFCSGPHTFQFSVTLPDNLPSSVQAGYGKIRYSIKATITRPSALTDDEVKRSFTVNGNTDLNQFKNIMYPQSGATDIPTRSCLSFRTGSIRATLSINRRGFVPGEYINIMGEVANNTSRPLKSTRVQLRMVLTFRSSTKTTKKVVRIISSSRRGEVEPRSVETWTGKKLHVPPLPPSPLLNCRIMAISYYIVLMVEPSRYSADFEVPINILVGTVPHRNVSITSAETLTKTNQFNNLGGSTTDSIPSDDSIKNIKEPVKETIVTPSSPGFKIHKKSEFKQLKEETEDHPDSQFMPVFSYFSKSENDQCSSDENT